MDMHQKFTLKLSAQLPGEGFSLDELVIETKKLFETEGMVGFLRVVLILLDHIVYPSCLGASKAKCCKKPYFVVCRSEEKNLRTSVGALVLRWTRLRCESCKKSFIPLKEFLGLVRYQKKTNELERVITEVVSEQSYRRTSQHLETIGEIPVPHTTLHRWVMKSESVEIDQKMRVESLVADGTGFKKKPFIDGSNRGEMKIVIGITKDKKLVPYGAWGDRSWWKIGSEIKKANHSTDKIAFKPIAKMLVSDGEEELIDGLKRLTQEQQRCTWHIPYGLGPLLRKEGVGKEQIQEIKSDLYGIINIELPKKDCQEVKLEDKLELEKRTWEAEKQLDVLINEFLERGYRTAARYLQNAKDKMFSYVRSWLKTGVVHPRVTSQIERMMREIGRRIKKIGHGWSPEGAERITRIIIRRITSPVEWDNHWKEKMRITGNVKLNFLGCEMI